jgi:hypothetical protein
MIEAAPHRAEGQTPVLARPLGAQLELSHSSSEPQRAIAPWTQLLVVAASCGSAPPTSARRHTVQLVSVASRR